MEAKYRFLSKFLEHFLHSKTFEKRCLAWHKNTNILLFFKKIVILGFYAVKSHNLMVLGIFHGDLNLFDLREKSLDLSNYEIFQHKILKSLTFKKSSKLIVKNLASCPFFDPQ
jgi:hypothetical protein